MPPLLLFEDSIHERDNFRVAIEDPPPLGG